MNNFLHPPRYTRKPLHAPKINKPKPSKKEKIIRWSILGIFLVVSYVAGWMNLWAQQITNGIAYIASKSVGETMKKDEYHRINILLVGYGGGTHDGAQLADSVMVASYDPKAHRVSMLSLPRDLIVLNKEGKSSKLNAILSRSYNTNGRDIAGAAQDLITTVEKVTGLEIPYYAMIDFNGFVELVDGLGGIDIYVPQHFLDREYPVDWNGTYEIFELFEGRNHLSGPNTLKYARSRHSTSDFSRSKRQQKIIEAIAKKILSD